MRKVLIFLVLLILSAIITRAQGVSNIWLIGYTSFTDQYTSSTKATIDFNLGMTNVVPSIRKMKFSGTQGNISDGNGNLLMASNGLWIANASNDTMLNGSGLNPGPITQSWPDYLPMPNCNVFLPWPGDSSKYVLFHMVANPSMYNACSELFYTIIDMTLSNGLGGVISKNQVALQDTFSWGIGVCKHANGRDWWIVVLKDNSNVIKKLLLTPNGLINMGSQSFGTLLTYIGTAAQLIFSPNGQKFAYNTLYGGPSPYYTIVKYLDFDRCTGQFSNLQTLPIFDTNYGFGTAFSPNSKYLYACTTYHVFQFNTDTSNIMGSIDTVATNDTFFSPVFPLIANFYLMYLANDNKIYITSNNGVVDLHYINYPDSGGVACDVRQHDLHLPCYQLRGVPNHPNYFLGAEIGSICDSLQVGVAELNTTNINIKLYPNPANDFFWLDYDISHVTGNGKLIIYNTFGEVVLQKTIFNYFKTIKVDCCSLPQGVYYILLEQNNIKTGSGKFVKL